MEYEVTFSVPMRRHPAIHGIKANTAEGTVKHGDRCTHNPPSIFLLLLWFAKYNPLADFDKSAAVLALLIITWLP